MITNELKIYYTKTMKMHRHHLLEIILWPNEDGSFTQIINDEQRLKDLGIYDDYKLTISIDSKTHSRLHNAFPSAKRLSARQKCVTAMQNSNIGRIPTDETRRKISVSRTGMKFTDEHRYNLSVSHKGRLLGYKHTASARANMSKAQKGRIITQEHRVKLSERKKGRKWFNNGTVTIQAYECPDGFKPGRLKNKKKEDQKF